MSRTVRSLASKFSIFTALLVLWVSVTLVSFYAVHEYHAFASASRNRAAGTARFLSTLLPDLLIRGDRARVRTMAEAAFEPSSSFRVSVVDRAGVRLAGHDPRLAGNQVRVAVYGHHQRLAGWVIVTWDSAEYRGRMLASIFGACLIGIMVLLVSVAVARLTSRWMVRPLVALEAVMRSATEGRLQEVAINSSGDEIERVGASFNRMVGALTRSRAQLREQQDSLEERIRQRTQTLEDALARAESANRSKSEFLANMSHELRTPMNGVIGMLDVTLDSELAPQTRDNLMTVRASAESLFAVLSDILDISRIETGQIEIERTTFELRSMLERCLESFAGQAREKGLEFSFRMQPETPSRLKGDPVRLGQVLDNLVENAIKFTDSGRVDVWAGCERADGGQLKLWFEIADTGTGIRPDEVPLIFQKFTQVDGTSTRRHGGTGLGLAIAHGLVRLHGGRIMVESEIGKGSTFRFWVPVEESSTVVVMPDASADLEALPGPPRHILIVEDNVVNQKVAAALLRRGGYRYQVVANGKEALEALEKSSFDLVLMDVQMPVMDGYEATRLIRGDPRWLGLPVVAMTAHALDGDRERCLGAGMDDYIAKPVRSKQLLEIVRANLSGERAARSAASSIARGSPLNEVAALRLMDNDTKLLEGVILLFLNVAPDRLRRLSAGVESGDIKSVLAECEKLKISADGIAAESISRLVHELELRTLASDLGDTAALLFQLRAEIEKLQQYVAARRGLHHVEVA